MKISDFSPQFPVLWASGGTTTTVQYPLLSGTALATGRASIASGFPAVNFTPPAAGGVYPWGADWNGALKTLSVSAQNYEAGVIPLFSQSFANSIGGYPQNAIVADASTAGLFWVSTADANTTVPGASGAAWQKFGWNQFVKQGWGFSDFGNNLIYIGWRTDGSGLGLGVDGTDAGTFALKADVMPSQSVFGQASQVYYTPTPNSSQTTTHIVDLTFTAPYDGLVYASASFNVSNIQPSQCQGLIQIEGSSYQPSTGSTVWSDTTLFPMSGSGLMRVKKGDNITIVASYNLPSSSSTFASVGQTITYTFTPAGY
ncbi:hypothetical protein JK202_10885 [Gluconobacter sp. Dm-62]|uniref:hypothetical protein n=1 Tax=Gluconobacter sp. Dm-62 TaxID=2799804 RepID=UPI001B8C0FFE|nr:hypothetical protein [Gluconobacter sp. Dm-62]MBS1103514.1 hypothetical protein [Gluconobacter sp. Dm-62]